MVPTNKPTGDISKRGFRIGAALILALALALRIMGARGDLAQDEITSLGLVGKVTRFDQVFWAINNDNSHILNSAWLYLVGPRASFLAMRALSIATGTGAVLVAGLWGARRSRLTGLIAMALFATSYLMVNYASEARGYAGMTLCLLLGVIALENTLSGIDQRLRLGGIVLIGTLFHFDMIMAAGVMGLTCLLALWQRTGKLATAFDTTIGIFTWPGIAIAAAIAPALLGHYKMGHIEPFHFSHFLGADNLALQTALNVPYLDMRDSDLILAVIAAVAWFHFHRRDVQAIFYIAAIILLPVALGIDHVPNTDEPRHFILCGIASIMLAAQIAEAAWRKSNGNRIAACIALMIIVYGNGLLLQQFLSVGRGHYSQAVAAMTQNAPTTYGMEKPQLASMVDFYSRRQQATPTVFIPLDQWCAKGQPQFMILAHVVSDPFPPASIVEGPAACPAQYALRQDYPAWGLTGSDWLLFERAK